MKTKWLRWGVLLILLMGIVLAVTYSNLVSIKTLNIWVQGAGIVGPLLFISVYIIGTIFFIPGSILTVAGGILFGPVMGSLYNLTAATIGSLLSFLMARYIAFDWVNGQSGQRFKQISAGIEKEGWRFVAFVRLVPLFPFNFLNYALGLTKIKVSHYVIASFICMLPGAVAYTYLGHATSVVMTEDITTKSMVQVGSIALALIAIVAFLPRLIRHLRQDSLQSKS
ncbi:DedA family protein, putative [hydrothermal vent metagenome]|uniref:DedA family protein, putative n=1 Tax=hydrothermal vent metagenome TaxID=652676 RepID=A0A3B0Y5L3_9ZZZZ